LLVASATGPVAAQDEWTAPDPDCPGYDPDTDIIALFAGDVAPFDGIFFTMDGATCEFNRFEICEAAARAEMARRKALCQANAAAFAESSAAEITARDETILILEDELEDALEEPWYQSFTFRVSLGFVVGVGAGYLLHELIN
jgi:hypothetical protein